MTAQHILGRNCVRGAERGGGDVDNRAYSTENLDRKVRCGPTDSLRSEKTDKGPQWARHW
jgi:hypothetical protein